MPDDPMAHPPKARNQTDRQTDRTSLAQQQRHARLAAELRSNLGKRKAQARTRALQDTSLRAPGGDEQPDQSDAHEAATGAKGEAA